MKRSKDARWRLGEDVGSRERVWGGGRKRERELVFMPMRIIKPRGKKW